MITGDLLDYVRSQLRDIVGDASEVLWTDTELINNYGNAAIYRMCMVVGYLIMDSTTADGDMCIIPLVQGDSVVALNDRVIRVDSVHIASQTKNLKKVNQSMLNILYPAWRTMANGTPAVWCPDVEKGHIVVAPPLSDLTDTAYLTVSRLPIYALDYEEPTDIIEVPEEYCLDIATGILGMAFGKKDPETDRPDTAKYYTELFLMRCQDIRNEIAGRYSTNLSAATPGHGMMTRTQ